MSDTITITPVIMSGGAGTRLWPISRKAQPKQLRALMGEQTLLQQTALRTSGETEAIGFAPPMIVCNAGHRDEIARQLAEAGITPGAIILEPMGRNTAPCAAAAAILASESDPNALLLLLPADHHIEDAAGFRKAIERGAAAAQAGDLVTFGIRPTGPETGYGYIRRGQAVGDVYHVDQFVEKPARETAQRYLEEGLYSWNAGIFLFRADRLMEEMSQHEGDVQNAASRAVADSDRSGGCVLLDVEAFGACPSISIDYAVMERTTRAAVLPMDIGWSDIGSWSALWELAEKDETGVASDGPVWTHDAANCYLRSDGPALAAVGVENLVVIASGGAILVIDRNKTQDVKAIVEQLKAGGKTDLL